MSFALGWDVSRRRQLAENSAVECEENKRRAATMNHLKRRYFAFSSKLVTPTCPDGNENDFISMRYTLCSAAQRCHYA